MNPTHWPCRKCAGFFELDELAADTGLCYSCEQRPLPVEESAFRAGVTDKQAREVMEGIARRAADHLPLTASSVGRRIRQANRELKRDS